MRPKKKTTKKIIKKSFSKKHVAKKVVSKKVVQKVVAKKMPLIQKKVISQKPAIKVTSTPSTHAASTHAISTHAISTHAISTHAISTHATSIHTAQASHPASAPRYRFVKDLLGWTMVVVFVFGSLSAFSEYGSNGTAKSITENKLTQASSLTAQSDGSEATVLAVGDISLARYIETKTRGNKDYTLPFANVGNFLKSADITIGSFNNPLLPGRTTAADSFILRADPKSTEGLLYAGFDLLNVANNQVLNFKDSGLLQTLSILRKANIQTVGAGKNMDAAHTPAIFDVSGKKIAFYGYVDSGISPDRDDAATVNSAGLATMNIEAMKNDVKSALTKADFVIVMMHAGTEYKKEPTQLQKDFAHAAIDAGASVVIGTHPHVVQPVEEYGKGVIFYSLGNFVFDQYFSDAVRTGLAVKLTFADKGTAPSYELVPVRADSYQPYIPEGDARAAFLKQLGL